MQNSVYWYNSCGNAEQLYQNCGSGQTCRFGQCTADYIPVPTPVPNPVPAYVKYYRKACYLNSIYWFDSYGYAQKLYKSCNDSNPATKDTCSAGQCVNTQDNNYQPPVQQATVSVSFFAKKDPNAIDWGKTAEVGQNSTIYFLAAVKNNTDKEIQNVNISAVIPAEVAMIGNVKIDGNPAGGDIINGIAISSIPANGTKTVTFEGKTQSFATGGQKQAVANAKADNSAQSDSLNLNFVPGQPGAVLEAPAASGFLGFIKRWYLWILVAMMLVFLFVVIFRRLSQNA